MDGCFKCLLLQGGLLTWQNISKTQFSDRWTVSRSDKRVAHVCGQGGWPRTGWFPTIPNQFDVSWQRGQERARTHVLENPKRAFVLQRAETHLNMQRTCMCFSSEPSVTIVHETWVSASPNNTKQLTIKTTKKQEVFSIMLQQRKQASS